MNDDLIYLLLCVETHADKFPVPDHMRLLVKRIRDASTVSGKPVAWQRKHPSEGWLEVMPDDIEHYRREGQEVRPLYAHPAPTRAEVLEEATAYAERLAVALHEKHWKSDAPQWKPLSGDLIGILTQIDNMTAGLSRAAAPSPTVSREEMLKTAAALRANSNGDCGAIRQAIYWEQKAAAPHPAPTVSGEPVAWRVRVTDNGRTMYVYTERLPFEPLADSGVKVRSEPEPLYLHPAPTVSGEPECTDCGGTGLTYQTERRCSCHPAPTRAEVLEALKGAERVLEWNVGSRVVGEPEPKPVLEHVRSALRALAGEKP